MWRKNDKLAIEYSWKPQNLGNKILFLFLDILFSFLTQSEECTEAAKPGLHIYSSFQSIPDKCASIGTDISREWVNSCMNHLFFPAICNSLYSFNAKYPECQMSHSGLGILGTLGRWKFPYSCFWPQHLCPEKQVWKNVHLELFCWNTLSGKGSKVLSLFRLQSWAERGCECLSQVIGSANQQVALDIPVPAGLGVFLIDSSMLLLGDSLAI